MKIRITKADGKSVEVTDVYSVRVIECARMDIIRSQLFGDSGGNYFRLELDGPNNDLVVSDSNIPSPFPPIAIG
jgi:hypothetical protein